MSKAATPVDALVGARLRARRKHLGISQTKLGNEVGVSFQQVQKYENGTNRIGAGRLAEIGRVLDVPIAYFFENAATTGVYSEPGHMRGILMEAGAQELLHAFAQISLGLRNTVIELARDLAREGAEKRAPAKRRRPRGRGRHRVPLRPRS
jgi:transcriptional regulator with XRE-family HTH domain